MAFHPKKEKMGSYPYRAIIQDAIHGSIRINEAEYWLLQTPFLRRLHNIRQLGLNFLVFPSASHTRLSHSLGVMHIASRIAERITRLAEKDSKVCAALVSECTHEARFSFIQLARIAGLIHDIGHLPFSHVGEEAFFQLMQEKEVTRVLDKIRGPNASKPHEAYTYFFGKKLVELARDSRLDAPSNLESYIELFIESLRVSSIAPQIGLEDKLRDLAENLHLSPEGLGIVRSIISHEIADADRLDYLRRDAWFTGVIYGYTDLDRMIEGIYVEIREGRPLLKIDKKTTQSIEDIFDSRLKMYRSVYHHHKSVAFRITLKNALDYIYDYWDQTGRLLYSKYDSLEDLLDPEVLSSGIAEGSVYFDDVETEAMVRLLLRVRDKKAIRWAKALLHDRRLTPISLIKRQEDLTEALFPLGMSQDIHSLFFEKIQSMIQFIINKKRYYDELRSRLSTRISRITGVDPSHIEVYISHSDVGGIGNPADKGIVSVYLNFLNELASIPTLNSYVYSDYEDSHLRMYRYRNAIRKEFISILRDILASLD